jgi:tRNA(Ile)-lysidine synthase TilS/MesJ
MKHFLEKYHIGLDDKLVIACSGGADSMFLLCEVL